MTVRIFKKHAARFTANTIPLPICLHLTESSKFMPPAMALMKGALGKHKKSLTEKEDDVVKVRAEAIC